MSKCKVEKTYMKTSY